MLCQCLLCKGVHQNACGDTVRCMQSTGLFPPMSVLLLTPQADLQGGVYWEMKCLLTMETGEWCRKTWLCFAVKTWWMFFPCRMLPGWSWNAPPSCPTCSPSCPTVPSQTQCWWLCSPSSHATSSACGRARRARRCTAGWVLLPGPSSSQTLDSLTKHKPFMGYSIWMSQVQLKNSLSWKWSDRDMVSEPSLCL